MNPSTFSRRQLLQTGAVATTGALLAACTDAATPPQPTAPAQADTEQADAALAPTPACDDGDDPTPAQTAGPFYTPDTPQRTSLLEADTVGTLLLVTGRVLTTDCRPIADVLLDFWQADDSGAYDNAGFRLRGHQFSDAEGRYELETIVPGLYPGRTRHIHVRVQPQSTEQVQPNLLTTQLYFPNEPTNARDGIFDPALLVNVSDAADGVHASFDFVLA